MSEIAKEKNELPDKWKKVLLEDISSDISYGYTASSTDQPVGPRMLRITDIQNNSVNWDAVPYCNIDDSEVDKYLLAPNDIVFARTGATVGKSFLIPSTVANSIYASYLIRMRIDEGVDPKYISYFFHSSDYWLQIRENQVGIGQPNVNGSKLKKLKVPLAPPEQQKRIVAKIEELFSHIDTGIEALKKAKQLLKQYRQSVLKAAVTGELLGKSFRSETYKSINHGLESLGQGWSPKCAKEPSPSEDVWGVIKTTAVQSLEYLQEENKRLPEKLEPRPHLEVMEGDILVTRAGPRVRVGVCCLVKETRKKLMICDKVYRLRPDAETILPEYLEIVLNAPQVQKEIERLKTGISDSGVNLTQKRFVELEIPYPAIVEQKQLISLVYEKTEAIARLDNELEVQSKKAAKNKQSILASAFRGKFYG